jgi:hypothetical protein
MKNLLLLFTFSISSLVFSQNLDFENWITSSVTNLDDYSTTINDEPVYGPLTVLKSNDFYSGMYSLKLETIETPEGDTLFGYIINGDPETMAGGNALSTLTSVDSIIGYYKYDVIPNDTALILFTAKYLGNPTGGDFYTITGTQSTWKRFSYPVDALLADSFIFAAVSSNAVNEIGIAPGSYLMLDSIHLKHNIQGIEYIPNHSFENWSDFNWEDVDEWTTNNKYFIGQTFQSATKTSDAYSGDYACVLTTYVLNGSDTVPGTIIHGDWDYNGPVGGYPYIEQPEFMRLHYKTNLVGIDTARVGLFFKKNGMIFNMCGASFVEDKSTYTLSETPISLLQVPDTVIMFLMSGANPGSSFTVDDLELVVNVGITENFKINEVVAFPVPANDKLNFEISTINSSLIKISIYNTIGKLISTNNFNSIIGNQNISVDISTIEKGNYIYKIEIGDEVYSKLFIKN